MSKIHIALVGKEVLPVYYMVETDRPDKVYLIGTKENHEQVRNLTNVIKSEGVECYTNNEVGAYDKSCMDVCEKIYAENSTDDEFVYNLTGGTKLMAMAAFRSALNHGAKTVYTDSESCIDLETFEKTPLECSIKPETIFLLQGQKLKGKTIYRYDAFRTDCAERIRDFIRNCPKAYGTLKKEYDKNLSLKTQRRYEKKPFQTYDDGHLVYEYCDGKISIEYNGGEVFYSSYSDVYVMLFEGRWWESLVADAVSRWSNGRYEIWTSVKFEPNSLQSRNPEKNEIDVLVNVGNTLLFVECKSGNFDQNNIHKLSSIIKTYGSYKSKGVIVSLYGKNNELYENAKDDKVEIIIAPYGNFSKFSKKLDHIINKLKA